MSKESKVGLFFVIGIAMLFALSTQVGNLKYGKNDNVYTIKAKLPNVNGLVKNAKIKSRGLEIGYIEDLKLNINDVILTLKINNNVQIPKESSLSIEQESLLGVKYLNIRFSNTNEFIKNLEVLSNVKEYASMDETTTNISNVAKTLDKFVIRLDKLIASNEENINKLIINFNDTILEFKNVGTEFKGVGAEFKQTGITINNTLPAIMNKFDVLEDRYITLANRFDATGKMINDKLPNILTKFETLEDGVNDIVKNNEKRIELTLDSINDAFVSVDDASKNVSTAIKKVDKYLESTTRSTLTVGFAGEYLANDSDTKTVFSVDYSPKKDTNYLVDLVSTNDYRLDNNEIASTKLHEKGRTLYSAQYAKTYDNIRYRAGIVENTGGVGIDYIKNKNLKLSVDAYDFNAYNDARGNNPHLKTTVNYSTNNNLHFYTGYDNMLNKKANNIIFGVGVQFKDDDLKYFLGSMSK